MIFEIPAPDGTICEYVYIFARNRCRWCIGGTVRRCDNIVCINSYEYTCNLYNFLTCNEEMDDYIIYKNELPLSRNETPKYDVNDNYTLKPKTCMKNCLCRETRGITSTISDDCMYFSDDCINNVNINLWLDSYKMSYNVYIKLNSHYDFYHQLEIKYKKYPLCVKILCEYIEDISTTYKDKFITTVHIYEDISKYTDDNISIYRIIYRGLPISEFGIDKYLAIYSNNRIKDTEQTPMELFSLNDYSEKRIEEMCTYLSRIRNRTIHHKDYSKYKELHEFLCTHLNISNVPHYTMLDTSEREWRELELITELYMNT